MLERDEINERFLMDQIRPIIEGQPSTQVMALAISLLGSLAITSRNPKSALLEIAKHYLEMSKVFNQDGTLKSDEELEK